MAGFQPVDPKQSFPSLEEEVLARWKERDVFARQISEREEQDAPLWSFYEGPPTANGRPHSGHVLSRIFKDVYPRYRAMTGHRVPRKAGWDCHGLPVELEIEKELGITSKDEIEEYGIAEFNARCRDSVFRYVDDWDRLTERIGFWIDLDDPYVTMDDDYIESCWWAMRQMWDAGRLYEGHKVVPYCPRCGTALSSHEVASGYHDVTDTSAYVKLPVTGIAPTDAIPESPLEVGDVLVVWTTTPWTLISNAAVAAGPEVEYVRVKADAANDEVLVMARDLVEKVLGEDAQVLAHFPGEAIAGTAYDPPFGYITDYGPRGHTVLLGDFVTTDEGTGLVHTAIAFGEDDYRLGEEYGITLQNPVRLDGTFDDRVTRLRRPQGQGRRRGHRRRARVEREAAARRALPAFLSPLLALRHAAPLLREGQLVHRDEPGPRPDARRERADRLAPRPHQARAIRQVARGQRGLGALARPLLGDAAPDLGVPGRRLRRALLRRLARGPDLARRRRSPTTCTAPTSTRSSCPASARAAAARCAASPRSPTPGSTRARCPSPSSTTRSRTRSSSRSASRPTSSARGSTRPAAGSTRSSPSRSCSSTRPTS